MGLLVARRSLTFAGSLLVASLFVFLILAALPGDAAQTILGLEASPAQVATLRTELGLDRPLVERYVDWGTGLLRGDYGTSYVSRTAIGPLISQRFALTVPLALMAMGFALAVALPLGTYAASRQATWPATAVSVGTQVGIAIPAFWAGMMLITLVSVKLGWLPAGGFNGWDEGLGQGLRSLLLPAISIALVQAAILTRYVRSAVLDVMSQDYMRTALAKGNTPLRALRRHGLRNAALPVVTVLGLQLSFLLVGAVVIENVFFLPGAGRMLIQAIGQRDLLLVQGIVVTLTAMVLAINFIVDLAYVALDPRLRAA